jgi:hypothetical protein
MIKRFNSPKTAARRLSRSWQAVISDWRDRLELTKVVYYTTDEFDQLRSAHFIFLEELSRFATEMRRVTLEK